MKALLAVAWALLAALLGWRAIAVKAPDIEQDVATRSKAAVAQVLPDAIVDVDGRFVHLSGEAPDDSTLNAAVQTARHVYGALGPWKGLWVAKAVVPIAPSVSAVKAAGGAIALSGAVASDAAKASVGEAAKAAFSGAIDNRLVVSAAVGAADLTGLADAFAALSTFDSGSAVVTPGQVLLAGATGDKAVAEAATALGQKSGWSVNVAGPAGDLSAPRVAELEAALAKAKAEVEAAAARAAAAQTALAQAKAEADALRSRVAELEKLAAGGGEADNKLLADLEAAKAALADAEAKRAAAETAAAQCAARAEAAEKASGEARAALDAANRRIAELEAALAGKPGQPAAPALTADACNAMMLKDLSGASITFGTNSAVVTPQGAEVLDAIARDAIACAAGGAMKVEVGGHTDNRGDDAANLRLSQRRADAVRDALVLRNVPGDAITAVGYGETKPIEDNETETGRQANRRIEFIWTAR